MPNPEEDFVAVIRTEGLTRIYRNDGPPITAVDHVSLTVEEGEFAAIVGPSGSGKTTLLNLIGGLDSPTSGRIQVGGEDIAAMSGGARVGFRLHHIGFVFQAYNLIPVLTAEENVEFIMLLQKRPAAERAQRARELLEKVGLGAQLRRRPHELSGGQQQRVAVARALASLPSFVLADEPTANLDSASADNLLDIMERLNREQKMTFVFSTHDPRVVARAQRVVTLCDGRVVSDEPRA
jgi:putative ABC transport system ATP-binding protein